MTEKGKEKTEERTGAEASQFPAEATERGPEKKPKRKKATLLQKRDRKGYLFILPWLIGFLLFYVRSLIMTIQFSFSELKMDARTGAYQLKNIGFENFRYAFRVHPQFKQILTTSVVDIVIDVPLIIFFSLFMAILLNRKFRGRGLVRAIFFLPVLMNAGAITAAMELSAQMMNGGVASQAAETVKNAGESVAFNMDYLIDMFVSFGIPSRLLNYMVSAVDRIGEIIRASGVQIIIFIAALQSIPSSLYEVAKIEGATGYETFWKVTFPMVMPHIITNIVYTIVDSYGSSGVVELAYSTAFGELNYGLSAVFSLVSMVVTILILVLVVNYIQKRTFYYT